MEDHEKQLLLGFAAGGETAGRALQEQNAALMAQVATLAAEVRALRDSHAAELREIRAAHAAAQDTLQATFERMMDKVVSRPGAAPTARGSDLKVSKLWGSYCATFAGETWASSVRDLMKAPLAHFGDRFVTDIRRADWTFYRDQIRKKQTTRMGGPPSVGTRNMELVRFKAMLNWAVDQEQIESNPLARMKKERARPARETTIGDEGLERLLGHSGPLLRAFILVAIDSGMRKNEVRNLKWPQIEDSGRVRVSWTVAKTKRSRSVRLSDRAMDALEALPEFAFSKYVFVNPNTGKPFSDSHFWTLFRDACVEAKATAAEGDGNVHFHDTRHDYITRTIQNGTPMVVAMRAAGHVTLNQASRYMHIDETDLDLMKAMNDKVIAAGRRSPKRAAGNPPDEKNKIKADL